MAPDKVTNTRGTSELGDSSLLKPGQTMDLVKTTPFAADHDPTDSNAPFWKLVIGNSGLTSPLPSNVKNVPKTLVNSARAPTKRVRCRSGQVRSDQIRSDQIRSDQIRSDRHRQQCVPKWPDWMNDRSASPVYGLPSAVRFDKATAKARIASYAFHAVLTNTSLR